MFTAIAHCLARSVVRLAKSLVIVAVIILIGVFIVVNGMLYRANKEYKACSWKYNARHAYYMYR